MKNEKDNEVYRKLIYFFENNLIVHFTDFESTFYNGKIIEINKKMNTMILAERIKGIMPILLEQIRPESIVEFGGVRE